MKYGIIYKESASETYCTDREIRIEVNINEAYTIRASSFDGPHYFVCEIPEEDKK